jgi:uncharacterized protein
MYNTALSERMMDFWAKSAWFVVLLLLSSLTAVAQAAPRINAQHEVHPDVPLKFLGDLGKKVETLRAMKPEQFEVTRNKASGGDKASQTLLCLAYRTGIPVPQDEAQALSWCQEGAGQGDPVATEELGMIYLSDSSEHHDAAKAIDWLTKAATLGSASAMDNLGTIYANGAGVPQDYAKAITWYLQSSKAGFPPADQDLGITYLLGQGVPADPRRGMELFTETANDGLPYSMFLLGLIYETGFGPVKVDRKAALEWFLKGAELGDVGCQGELGWIYANGIGAKKDYSLAVKWYRAAADQEDPVGAYGLAVRYMQGQGVAQDALQAMYWFQKAADAGHADAAYNLAAMLANQIPGHIGPPDYNTAAKYLAIAANQNISDAQCLLGLLYYHGFGVPQDNVSAYKWILLSQRGSHACDQDEVALRTMLAAPQLEEAKRGAAEFKPARSKINYGDYAAH